MLVSQTVIIMAVGKNGNMGMGIEFSELTIEIY